eukprot:Skav230943  [mRNA]  locus=scaffold2774:195990:214141:- [translate_table: standard]
MLNILIQCRSLCVHQEERQARAEHLKRQREALMEKKKREREEERGPKSPVSPGSTATTATGSSSSTHESSTPRRRYETRGFWDEWYRKQGDTTNVEWSGPVNDLVFTAITGVLERLQDRIPPSKEPLRVCELGCGCSHLAAMLRDFGVKVVGVDFSQEVINANKLRYPDIDWQCLDALQLASHFKANYFDAIVGKTLIDCFMTRTDAAGSIRQLMQQCHAVLKDHGCVMLLDKACAESIIGRGRTRQITVDMHKTMTFRVLHVQPRWRPATSESTPCQRQWELEIEPSLQKHFVVRPAAAGSGSLQVWSSDHVANVAGIETGDLVVGPPLLWGRRAAGAARRKTASLKTRMQVENALQLHNLFLGRAIGAVFGASELVRGSHSTVVSSCRGMASGSPAMPCPPRDHGCSHGCSHGPGTMLGGWLCDVCPIKLAMSCCIGSSLGSRDLQGLGDEGWNHGELVAN